MSSLRAQIQKQDFDHPFTISQGDVYAAPVGFYAPSVWHDETNDIDIDDHRNWTAITGFTGQYSYSGAVMHASEQVSRDIADHLAELAEDNPSTVFAIVTVEVHADEDDEDPEPAGWTIVHTYR